MPLDASRGERLIFGIEEWLSALAILLVFLTVGIFLEDFTNWMLRRTRIE